MEEDVVVVDNGSGVCRAGFAGEDLPRTVFPSIVGRSPGCAWSGGERDTYVGDDAQSKRGILSLKHPVQRGIVKDWGAMEELWHHMFYNELQVLPENHPVLISEASMNPKANREKMAQIMMETFCVPGFYVALHAVLSLYASGRGTAVLVDCGEGVTTVVPIYQSYAFPHADKRLEFAGSDLTGRLGGSLREKYGIEMDEKVVRDVKEKFCYVASDINLEKEVLAGNLAAEQGYELPDGRVITLGEERCQGPETFFQPWLFGFEFESIHDMIRDSIVKCPLDVRRDMYQSVVLSGGTTMLRGFAERLRTELRQFVPPRAYVRIVAAPGRQSSVWVGGSILASLSSFQSMWITKQQYDEVGPGVAHRTFVAP